jgi:acyl-coenzyme A thioesterase PaaI-like protein
MRNVHKLDSVNQHAITAKTAWERLGKTRLGRWIFGRIIRFKAPYFATIRPEFQRLEPGCCQVVLRKQRAVLNHVGTVHAIAMCNAAELAAGLATEVMLPASYRWIPKGMSVNYLKPAKTDLVVVAQAALPENWGESTTLDVTAEAKDKDGITVFRAVITMHVSKRR